MQYAGHPRAAACFATLFTAINCIHANYVVKFSFTDLTLLVWHAVDIPAVLALAVSTAGQDVASATEFKERSLLATQWGGMSASQAQAQAQAGEFRIPD
jgi:hypothetical protein